MARRTMGPATLALHRAVTVCLDRSGPTGTVLVGCSGGPDSLALCAVTQVVVRPRPGRRLVAVVVDHGLQPGSAEIAAGVQGQLTALDIDAEVVAVAVGTEHGPEAAARQARYAALTQAADRFGADLVLLGHTLDDQAETVLLGLARGSGTRSLAGMAPVRDVFARPLLGLRRSVTADACTELGLTPWQDPHNDDPAYARVRVRRRVLPVLEAELGPGVAAALARTADQLRDDADVLDRLAAEAYPRVLGAAGLDCAALAGLDPSLHRRVLRRYLIERGAREVTAAHLDAAAVLLEGWRGQHGVDLPGVRVVREHGVLRAVAG